MTQLYTSILDQLFLLDNQPVTIILVNPSYFIDPTTQQHLDDIAPTYEITGGGYARAVGTLALVEDTTAGTLTLSIVDAVSFDRTAVPIGGWVVAREALDDFDSALICFQADTSSDDPFELGALTALVQIRTAVDAADIGYSPDEPTDWLVPPGTTAVALDEIAARLTALEAP